MTTFDTCVAANQIGTYAPSEGGSGGTTSTLTAINAVTIETDTLDFQNLLIGGVSFDEADILLLEGLTLYQSASSKLTQFQYDFDTDIMKSTVTSIPTINSNGLALLTINDAVSVTGPITCLNTLGVLYPLTTITDFSLSPKSSGSAARLNLGLSASYATQLTYYTVDNTCALNLAGISTPVLEVSTSRFTTPKTVIYGTTTELNPIRNLTLTALNAVTTTYKNCSWIGQFSVSVGNKITFHVSNWCKTAGAVIPYIQVSGDNTNWVTSTTGVYKGYTSSNFDNSVTNKKLVWKDVASGQEAGIPFLNSVTVPTGTSAFDTTIEFTYIGTIGGYQTWIVSGNTVSLTTNHYYTISGKIVMANASYPVFNSFRMYTATIFSNVALGKTGYYAVSYC